MVLFQALKPVFFILPHAWKTSFVLALFHHLFHLVYSPYTIRNFYLTGTTSVTSNQFLWSLYASIYVFFPYVSSEPNIQLMSNVFPLIFHFLRVYRPIYSQHKLSEHYFNSVFLSSTKHSTSLSSYILFVCSAQTWQHLGSRGKILVWKGGHLRAKRPKAYWLLVTPATFGTSNPLTSTKQPIRAGDQATYNIISTKPESR